MKTLKIALSLLMVFCMLLSFGTAAFANSSIPDNPEGKTVAEVKADEWMGTNKGTVTDNNGIISLNADSGVVTNNNAGGHIQWNSGTVTTNAAQDGGTAAGHVEYNENGGTVEHNNGSIYTNQAGGKVVENKGTVTINKAPTQDQPKGGEVTTNNGTIGNSSDLDNTGNFGTVKTNGENGVITVNQDGGKVETNNGWVSTNMAGGTVTNNNADGIITGNYGTVENNAAADAGKNAGYIENNYAGGIVTENNGIVSLNQQAKQGKDAGLIVANNAGGIVEYNDGTITTNNGTIGFSHEDPDDHTIYYDGPNCGTIVDNNGTVYKNANIIINNNENATVYENWDTIENNSGTVIINYGTVVNNFGDGKVEDPDYPAQNQFNFNVDITTENSSVDGTTNLTLFDGKYWMNEKSEDGGSITVNPVKGYTLDASSVDNTPDSLTVTEENGGLLLTFKKLLSNLKLKITGKAKAPDPGPTPDPDLKPDPKPEPKPVAAATNDWSDCYYLFNKAVVKQIKNAEDGSTVTVDATGWASFMRMVFEALAEHPTVTLVVKYGNNRELTVPAGADILSAIGDAQDVLFTKLAKLV